MKSSRKRKTFELIKGDRQVGRDIVNFPDLSLKTTNQLKILHLTILYLGWVFAEHAISLTIKLTSIKLVSFNVTPEADCLIFLPVISPIMNRDDL